MAGLLLASTLRDIIIQGLALPSKVKKLMITADERYLYIHTVYWVGTSGRT